MGKLLVGCEFSGIVRDAFEEEGHDATSCDLLPSDRPGKHIVGDIFEQLDKGWDLLIFHWPCTYLCRAGAGWCFNIPTNPKPDVKYGADRYAAMIESARCFDKLMNCGILRIAGENPRPFKDAAEIMGKPSQVIQPYEFGHPERKATCLWLRNLPKLEPTNIVPLPKDKAKAQRLHWLSPGPNRWKERSKTYKGIAKAMAQQWGKLL